MLGGSTNETAESSKGEIMSLPACFGVFWEAIKSNPVCNEQCLAKNECLKAFAAGILVDHQNGMGEGATPSALSAVTGVKVEAILLAIAYQNGEYQVDPVVPVREPVTAPAVQNPEIEITTLPPAPAPTPKRIPPTTKAGKADKAARDRSVKRFHGERQRNPLIQRLPVGFVLKRKYPAKNGRVHSVAVDLNNYIYKGAEYPTLYMVMKAITGGKLSWSADRFFNLEKIGLPVLESPSNVVPKRRKKNPPRRKG